MAQPQVQPQILPATPAPIPNTRHPRQDAADADDQVARQDAGSQLTRRKIGGQQQRTYFQCSDCHVRRALKRRAGTDNQGRPRCRYCRDHTPVQQQQKWCIKSHEEPRTNFFNLDHIERETCSEHDQLINSFTCRICNTVRHDRHTRDLQGRRCIWCTDAVPGGPLAYCDYADHVMFDTEFRQTVNPTAVSSQCRHCEAIRFQVDQDRVRRDNNIANANNQRITRNILAGFEPSALERAAAYLRFGVRRQNLRSTPLGHDRLNTVAGLWRGVKNLGSGSSGCTALYVQERGGVVVDRVVVKSERADDPNNWGWSNNS